MIHSSIADLTTTLPLAAVLATASAIDLREHRLPDWLTLPLVAMGLLVTSVREPAALPLHLLGAALGFLSFWVVAYLYFRMRGVEGLGMGDAKLLAAAGAWLGPLYLAPVVLCSASLAIGTVLILRVLGRALSWQSRLPFGPFISVGFFVFWCLKLYNWPPW
jgi:leader peptidase (prepilin peptidase)/N-methyltransferase